MNISLRRAAALQNSIQECLRGIALEVTVKLNEFQDAESVLTQRQTQLAHNLAQRQKLITALYQIRAQVGDANHAAGIDQRLTEIARMERLIQDHQVLAGTAVRTDGAVIAGELAKRREAKPESRMYGYDSTVETTIMRAEDIQACRRQVQELRRARQRVQDEVLELNVRTEISLHPDTVQLLQAHDLI